MTPTPTLAPSLVQLRREVDARWPRRDRRSDGWLGDAAHAARKSEHNPDDRGVVHALDLDTDGIDVEAVVRRLIGDRRVWYVIHDRTIWSRTYGWRANRYTGADPHTGHIHVSIQLNRSAETDTGRWLEHPAHKATPHYDDALAALRHARDARKPGAVRTAIGGLITATLALRRKARRGRR